jgi:hypothetical protein
MKIKKINKLNKLIELLNNSYPLQIETLMDISINISKAKKDCDDYSCKYYRTDEMCNKCNCWKATASRCQ